MYPAILVSFSRRKLKNIILSKKELFFYEDEQLFTPYLLLQIVSRMILSHY